MGVSEGGNSFNRAQPSTCRCVNSAVVLCPSRTNPLRENLKSLSGIAEAICFPLIRERYEDARHLSDGEGTNKMTNVGGATMRNGRMILQALLCFVLVLSLILPAVVAGATSATAHVLNEQSLSHSWMDSSSAFSAMALNTAEGAVTPMVAAGDGHTVGLRSDGTVVAVGFNDYGQCDVGAWVDIVQVSAGLYHSVALKSDRNVFQKG